MWRFGTGGRLDVMGWSDEVDFNDACDMSDGCRPFLARRLDRLHASRIMDNGALRRLDRTSFFGPSWLQFDRSRGLRMA